MTVYDKCEEKYQAYCNNKISLEEWQSFCKYVLREILMQNKDILEFMKNERW